MLIKEVTGGLATLEVTTDEALIIAQALYAGADGFIESPYKYQICVLASEMFQVLGAFTATMFNKADDDWSRITFEHKASEAVNNQVIVAHEAMDGSGRALIVPEGDDNVKQSRDETDD